MMSKRLGQLVFSISFLLDVLNAATISQFSNFSISNTVRGGIGSSSIPTTTTVIQTISQFDNLGGTLSLTGVKITVDTETLEIETSIQGANNAVGGQNQLSLTPRAILSFSLPGGAVDQNPYFTFNPLSTLCTATGVSGTCNSNVFNIPSGLPMSFVSSAPGGPNPFSLPDAAFIGTGFLSIPLNLDLSQEISRNSNNINLVRTGNSTALWSGKVTVEYTYENAVPEPATLAVIASSLLCMATFRRMRSR